MNIIQNNIEHWTPAIKTQIRKSKRHMFIYDNISLFKELDKLKEYTYGKYPIVKKITEKARKEIGYSENTASCDIAWTLLCAYRDIFK